MRHIIPISGKDSLATAIVQTTRKPDLDYEFVFNPTGLELPEVFEWIERVEAHLKKDIVRVGRNLKDIIALEYNYFLPGPRSRYCTRQSKIEPFVEWIGGEECTVYYGIRADEDREGFNNQTSPNITPVYPLKESLIDLRAVYLIVNNFNLKPPTFFWKSVHAQVVSRLQEDPRGYLPEWIFDSLFAWRTRANCDRCFNQAQYEWVGLLDNCPDRFQEAKAWEHLGGDGKVYHWNAHKSLEEIEQEADRIRNRRVNQIIKSIQRFKQFSLFKDDDSSFIDVLSVKSCGLFCGK